MIHGCQLLSRLSPKTPRFSQVPDRQYLHTRASPMSTAANSTYPAAQSVVWSRRRVSNPDATIAQGPSRVAWVPYKADKSRLAVVE